MGKAFNEDRFLADLNALVERHLERLDAPERFVGSDAALVHLETITREVRMIRGGAALELRKAPHRMTWPAIGELVDVSPQRAEQYAHQGR